MQKPNKGLGELKRLLDNYRSLVIILALFLPIFTQAQLPALYQKINSKYTWAGGQFQGYFQLDSLLNVGRLQLRSGGDRDTSFAIAHNTASITLDTIAADRTVTFPDIPATEKGVLITLYNSNSSAFAWNVAGPVIEASTGLTTTTLSRNLHLFYWIGNKWVHFTGSSSSSGGGSSSNIYFDDPIDLITGTPGNPDTARLNYSNLPQDTIDVVLHGNTLYNRAYYGARRDIPAYRDSSVIGTLGSVTGASDGVRLDGSTVKLENSFTPRISDNVVIRPAATKGIYLSNDAGDAALSVDDAAVGMGNLSGNVNQVTTTYGQIAGRNVWRNAAITSTSNVDLSNSANYQYFPVIKLTGTLSANRTLTMPSGYAENEWCTIFSTNGSAFKWQVAGASVYELDGTAITEFENNKTYDLIWNASASRWQRKTGGGGGAAVDSSVYATRGRLYKVADSLAIALAPNLSVYNAGPSGERVLFVRSDTVWGKKLVQGTGITITNNSDSTLTIAATGGSAWSLSGNTIAAADSILGTTSNNGINLISNNVVRGALTRYGSLILGQTTDIGSPVVKGVWPLQVHGSILSDDSIVVRKPSNKAFAMYATSSTNFRLSSFDRNLDFGNSFIGTTTFQASTWLQTPILYAQATTLQFNTGNAPGNNNNTIFTFTNGTPTTNSGFNYARLLALTKVVNRGSQDGPEQGLYIDFSVTGTSTDRQAIVVNNGRTIIKGFQPAIVAKTTTYTAVDDDYTITGDATGGAFTITLPTAVGRTGLIYQVKRINSGANAVTVGTTSSQTIDGSTTYSLSAQWKYVSVQSDGANWLIIANN